MRLDFLQNYPLDKQANQILISSSVPNASPIDPKDYAQINQQAQNIAKIFDANFIAPFNCLYSDWFVLFQTALEHYKIAYAISSHQQSYQAFKHFSHKIFKLIPNIQKGIIDLETIKKAIDKKYTCFILPFVNEDILTINDISNISSLLEEKIGKKSRRYLLIVDISYALSARLEIPKILNSNTLFLLNGESIGVLRGNGILIGKNFSHSLSIPPIIVNPKLYDALFFAIKNLNSLPKKEDTKNIIYEHLKSILGENLSLFAPLTNTLANALPLRFHSIKARNFLQALLIQKIYAINGQECLYGQNSPSFVLQEMGYSQLESRQLISMSYRDLPIPATLSKLLSDTYMQLRSLEI